MMIFPAAHQYGRKVNALRREFAGLAKAIAQHEPVIVFCHTPDEAACRNVLGEVPNLTIRTGNFSIDWARDNAPILLRGPQGDLAAAGFRFNGWGKKYPGWEKDVETRDTIAREMGWKIFPSELVLEGGSIEMADGIGIVTESCVLNPNRTHWPKEKVETELKRMLGLETLIWIKSGLMPDPITDGHVDGLLKFVSKDTVLLHTTDLESDPNHRISREARQTLIEHGLKVIELPLAEDIVHMNFYIGSGGKIAYVPVSGDPEQDGPALEIIGRFYDKIIPIQATKMGNAGGGVHCFTMQIPKQWDRTPTL